MTVAADPLHYVEEVKQRSHLLRPKLVSATNLCAAISEHLAEPCEADAIEKEYLRLRKIMHEMYQIMVEPDTQNGLKSYLDAVSSSTQKARFNVFSIDAVVDDCSGLNIKFPAIPSRYTPQFHDSNYYRTANYEKWFIVELENALLAIQESLPHFSRSHFAYLHIVNPQKETPADNDNRDIKMINDTVCSYLSQSDGALECSYSIYAMCSNTLPLGSYLQVSSTFGNAPSMAALHASLANVFASEKAKQCFKNQDNVGSKIE